MRVTEAQALGMFTAYLSLSLIFDFLMLLRGFSEGIVLLVIPQVMTALLILGAILRGIKKGAADLAAVASLLHLIGILGVLAHAVANWLYPAIAAFTSWLNSAVLTLLTVHRTVALAIALATSLAAFAVKLYSKEYRAASLMLFIAYIIALALLFSAAI